MSRAAAVESMWKLAEGETWSLERLYVAAGLKLTAARERVLHSVPGLGVAQVSAALRARAGEDRARLAVESIERERMVMKLAAAVEQRLGPNPTAAEIDLALHGALEVQ